MKWISVKDWLPDIEDEIQPHLRKLLLHTQTFGTFVGWYDGQEFRTSYAEILENVTHWMPILEPES